MFRAGGDWLQPQVLNPRPVLLSPLPPVELHQALGRVQAEVVRGAGQAGVVLLSDETRDQTGARIFLLTVEDLAVTAGNNQTVTECSPGSSFCEERGAIVLRIITCRLPARCL